jgi:hypothetical protein
MIIYIEKESSGHYHVHGRIQKKNGKIERFEIISSSRRFQTAMSEARKVARSFHKTNSVGLVVKGAGEKHNGKFHFNGRAFVEYGYEPW